MATEATQSPQTALLMQLLTGAGKGGQSSPYDANVQAILQQLQGFSPSGANTDLIAEDIIRKATEAFAVQKAAQGGAGAYTSQTQNLLRNAAMADAVKQATLASQQAKAEQDKLRLQALMTQAELAGRAQGATTGARPVDPARALLASFGTAALAPVLEKGLKKGTKLFDIFGGDEAASAGGADLFAQADVAEPGGALEQSYIDFANMMSAPTQAAESFDFGSLAELLPQQDLDLSYLIPQSTDDDAVTSLADFFS